MLVQAADIAAVEDRVADTTDRTVDLVGDIAATEVAVAQDN